MLDKPPSESKLLSWTYVGLAALVIFLTIPFARAMQSLVSESVGSIGFLVVVGVFAIVATYLAIVSIKARGLSLTAYICLAGVVAAFALYTYQLRDNPEEALHFVEYGILSLLVYRALTHSVRDYSIYITAALVVGSVGIIDEWIQWLTPSRVWDMRDIQINFVAGGLTQLAIVAGLRPGLVKGMPGFSTVAVLCRAAALTLFLLGLTFVNTPAITSKIASSVPGLSFLMENRNIMVEYGYLYEEPDIGIFRSRFTPDELSELDRRRGLEASAIIDEYISEEKFRTFLSIFSVTRDPYLHEIGVHLFRRNRYVSRAQTEPDDAPQHYNVSFRENQFLGKYFSTALMSSSHVWSPSTLAEVEAKADKSERYETRVSEGLITKVNEMQVLFGLLIGMIALTLMAIYFGRKGESMSGASGKEEEQPV